jgi:hypothetical protein
VEPIVREGRFELVAADGSRIDVLEGINRELARPILDAAKRLVMKRVEELSKKWINAAKEEILVRYEEQKARNNEINAARKAGNREKQAELIEYDGNGLPIVPLVQKYPELALEVKTNAKDKKGQPMNLGPSELEQQIAQRVIEEIQARYVQTIRAEADRIIESAEDMLLANKLSASPRWDSVVEATRLHIELFQKELRSAFPIGKTVEMGRKASVEAAKLAGETIPALSTTARINDDGVPEVVLPEIGVRAYYDVELGTLVLESSKGPVPNPNGLLYVVDHGDGTVKSNAASWKYVIAKFVSNGFNPMAINLPVSGIGMELTGARATTAYLDRRFRIVRERNAGKTGEPRMPLVHLGRSMGAAKGAAHAFYYDGPLNVVDAYVLNSFSNPFTLAMQIENVYAQAARGTIKGVVPEMLESALEFSNQFRAEIERVKAENPDAFKDFGDNQLYLQGRADEDGGPTVVADLLAWQRDFAPLSHVYVFENPLLKYKDSIPEFEKIDPAKWEGTHMLFSNAANITPEQGARIYPGVPKEDLPALQEQYFEAMAVQFGFFDYLAESRSPLPELKRAAETFRAYRAKFTGSPNKTFLEHYREKSKISAEELAAAQPGRATRPERLKKVIEFWKAETARIDAYWDAQAKSKK